VDNWRATLQTEYVNSLEMTDLIDGFNTAVDPAAEIAEFYSKVFDPATAVEWGLDCWGDIVAIARTVTLEGNNEVFGFDGSDLNPWDQAPFYSAQATDNYVLADKAYRFLVFLKAAVNLTDGSLADINRLLAWLFEGRGAIAALHVGTMHMRFLVRFIMEPFEQAIMQSEDVPPKPAGVLFDWYYVPEPTFGFDGSNLHPFSQGAFAPGGPVYERYDS